MPIHPELIEEGDRFLVCAQMRFSPRRGTTILRWAGVVDTEALGEDETESPRIRKIGRRQLLDEVPPDEKQRIVRIHSEKRPDPEVLEAAVEESINRQREALDVYTVHRREGTWTKGKQVKKVRVDDAVFLKCSRSDRPGDELDGLPSCEEFPSPRGEPEG